MRDWVGPTAVWTFQGRERSLGESNDGRLVNAIRDEPAVASYDGDSGLWDVTPRRVNLLGLPL